MFSVLSNPNKHKYLPYEAVMDSSQYKRLLLSIYLIKISAQDLLFSLRVTSLVRESLLIDSKYTLKARYKKITQKIFAYARRVQRHRIID